jgi:hypothetical protein
MRLSPAGTERKATMKHRFEADGDSWQVGIERPASYGAGAIVFHCTSNPQRPYRVLPLAPTDERLDRGDLDDGELRELFSRSQIMGFTHDPAARAA